MIHHHWHFLNKGYKIESSVFNSCHDILMMAIGLENMAILNIKGFDYTCINYMEYK